MKTCPRCAAMSPPTAFKCRSCGALLVAAPANPGSAPAPPTALAAAAVGSAPEPDAPGSAATTAVDDRFFAPATFTPATFTTVPRPDTRRVRTRAVIVVLAILAAGVVAFNTLGSHSSGHPAKTPVALAPLSDGNQGLPSLADAVRAQAEGGRSRAFSDVNQALSSSTDGRIDVAMLRQVDTTIEFLGGDESSKNSKQASFSQSDDTVVVAVSAASKDVCAYERQVGTGDPEVVTMGNVSSCRAADAPATGWIPLRDAGTSRGAVLPQN